MSLSWCGPSSPLGQTQHTGMRCLCAPLFIAYPCGQDVMDIPTGIGGSREYWRQNGSCPLGGPVRGSGVCVSVCRPHPVLPCPATPSPARGSQTGWCCLCPVMCCCLCEPGLSHGQLSVDGSRCEGVCAWFVAQDRVGDYYVAVIKQRVLLTAR